jgi:hypothetical protein
VYRGLIALLSLIIGLGPLSAQKYLLIEKAGNPHTERIAMYDDLTFQLRKDKVGWYTRKILDMDPNGQMIMLGDSWVELKDIERIRLKRKRVWPTILGGALQVGGITMFFGDVWYTLVGEPQFSEGGMQFGLINFAVGTTIRWLFEPIVYNLGKQKRLRVVDLTF